MGRRKKYHAFLLGGDEEVQVELPELFGGRRTVIHRARTAVGEEVSVKIVLCPPDRKAYNCEAQKFDAERYCQNLLRGAENVREVVVAEQHNRLPKFFAMTGKTWLLVYKPYTRETLRDVIESDRSVQPSDLREFLSSMHLGFASLRDHHVTHRDLKPENIFVHESLGHSYIGDFGLATYPTLKSDYLIGHGTKPYMAPELRRSRGRPQCDVFALGTVLYELLEKRTPFNRSDYLAGDSWDKHGNPKIQPVQLRGKQLREVSKELKKSLRKSPSRRHRNAHALVSALLVAGAKDGLWKVDPVAAKRVPKARRASQVSKLWRYEDNRTLGGALWFYISQRELKVLKKVSAGVYWGYHSPRLGFWTKDQRVSVRGLCRRANRRGTPI
jgi:serine/threonine protein kinase